MAQWKLLQIAKSLEGTYVLDEHHLCMPITNICMVIYMRRSHLTLFQICVLYLYYFICLSIC